MPGPWIRGILTFEGDSSTLGTVFVEVFMFLFGTLGLPEMLLILLIIVIIFGARRLPELGKSLGEGIKNFKKSVTKQEEEGGDDSSADKE